MPFNQVIDDCLTMFESLNSRIPIQGDVEYLKAAAGSQVVAQLQCPQMDAECPTCGEFQVLQKQQNDIVAQLVGEKKSLQKQVDHLLKMVFELKDSVEELERTALPHCWPDGKRINDGTTWREGCKQCICKVRRCPREAGNLDEPSAPRRAAGV